MYILYKNLSSQKLKKSKKLSRKKISSTKLISRKKSRKLISRKNSRKSSTKLINRKKSRKLISRKKSRKLSTKLISRKQSRKPINRKKSKYSMLSVKKTAFKKFNTKRNTEIFNRLSNRDIKESKSHKVLGNSPKSDEIKISYNPRLDISDVKKIPSTGYRSVNISGKMREISSAIQDYKTYDDMYMLKFIELAHKDKLVLVPVNIHYDRYRDVLTNNISTHMNTSNIDKILSTEYDRDKRYICISVHKSGFLTSLNSQLGRYLKLNNNIYELYNRFYNKVRNDDDDYMNTQLSTLLILWIIHTLNRNKLPVEPLLRDINGSETTEELYNKIINIIDNVNNTYTLKKKLSLTYSIDMVDYYVGHSCVLLIDKATNEAEFYDPYGYTYHNYENFDLENRLKTILTKHNYTYVSLPSYCPYGSIQTIQYNETQSLIESVPAFSMVELESCRIWSMWYIDMRMLNENVSRDKLVKFIFKKHIQIPTLTQQVFQHFWTCVRAYIKYVRYSNLTPEDAYNKVIEDGLRDITNYEI